MCSVSSSQFLRVLTAGLCLGFASPGAVFPGCGKSIYTSSSGVITSPNYPYLYPNRTYCRWQIEGGPGSIISITFDDFDVSPGRNCSSTGVDFSDCCTSSWFKIGVQEGEQPMVLCGRNLSLKQYLSIKSKVLIKFLSARAGGRGFKLSYLIIPILCRLNETLCTPASQECHPKCDHVMNCPSGLDEIGCTKDCETRVMCDSWNGCYTPDERCNGVAQCGDHSDERNCSPEFCRSERGGFLCSNRQCIRESWQCDQTNDCGDNSDELNCLKNSVITAAVMGSLICGLLLVIAVGCTCKLYALRYGGEASSSTLALSPLERELLQREPPPPYSIALSHPTAPYFQQAAAAISATAPSVQHSHQTTAPIHQQQQPTLHHHLLDPYYFTRLCRSSHHRRSRRLRRQCQPFGTSSSSAPSSSSNPPCLMVVSATHHSSAATSPAVPVVSFADGSSEPPPYGTSVTGGENRMGRPATEVKTLSRPSTSPLVDSAPDSTTSTSSTYSSTTTLLSSSGGTSSTDLSMDSLSVVAIRPADPLASLDDRPLLSEDQ